MATSSIKFATLIAAQQTVTPDAVTWVFPCVGGYKEFAPDKDSSQSHVSTGAQFFTPAYHSRSITIFSTRPNPHLPGAGEPGSWAAEQIQTFPNTDINTIKTN
jgi:hypothetical protein